MFASGALSVNVNPGVGGMIMRDVVLEFKDKTKAFKLVFATVRVVSS